MKVLGVLVPFTGLFLLYKLNQLGARCTAVDNIDDNDSAKRQSYVEILASKESCSEAAELLRKGNGIPAGVRALPKKEHDAQTAGESAKTGAVETDEIQIGASSGAELNEARSEIHKLSQQHTDKGNPSAPSSPSGIESTSYPTQSPVKRDKVTETLSQESPAAKETSYIDTFSSVDSCFAINQRYLGGEADQATTAEECRAKCLNKVGCSHFNFLADLVLCELVFAKGVGAAAELPPVEKRTGAIAAEVECHLPSEGLAARSLTGKEKSSTLSENAASTSLPLLVPEDVANAASKEAPRKVNPQREQKCSDKYVLSDTYKGDDFLRQENFFFFEWADPTGGTVKYLNRNSAQSLNLIRTTSDGRLQIYADTTEVVPDGQGRKSIRLTSQKAWSDAMWVLDLNHMPTGCGTWPAWWTVGWDPWPDNGEIDIIEGANVQSHAHSALHTKQGCTMPPDTENFNGYWSNTSSGPALNCWDKATSDNTGCSIESYEDAFGAQLNRIGGGLYVMQLHHDKYIRMWFFTRQEAPYDLINGTPTPDFWTKTPLAYFPLGSKCPGTIFFQEQRTIINTTFCGGYSGYNFTTANGCPGNGLQDCERYVRKNPQQFREAYWDISSLKVYKRRGTTCQTVIATSSSTTTSTTTSSIYNQPSDGNGGNNGSVTTTTTVTTSSKFNWWPWGGSAASNPNLSILVVIIGVVLYSSI